MTLVLPPLQNKFLNDYDPTKGQLTCDADAEKKKPKDVADIGVRSARRLESGLRLHLLTSPRAARSVTRLRRLPL